MNAAVYRDIVEGNRARDGHAWASAVDAYRHALSARPDLVHIHVQLGHVLRREGQAGKAEQAYREAIRQRPEDRDANLALGHLLKQEARWNEAAECYVVAALAGTGDDDAMQAARDAAARIDAAGRIRIAKRLDPRLTPADDGHGPCATARDLVFDVSDIVSFYGHSRRPTGIQRVQAETLIHVLGLANDFRNRVGLCAFLDGRDEWIAIPGPEMLDLARLSLAGSGQDEEEWRRVRDRLLLRLVVAEPAEFKEGCALVNLGTSWWLSNYFLHVRAAIIRKKIVYIPMIYDVIPAIMPDLCLDNLVQDFNAWASGIFAHADRFLAISQSTKTDLIALADKLGTTLDPARVAVIPLDGRPSAAGAPTASLPAPVKHGVRFVLFVATIEPRKGHLTAFDAWQRLIDQYGADAVPQLVCVGRDGWRNAAVYSRLAASEVLAAKVVIVSDLADGQLRALYDACLFSIYPSLYEGWGLPVTEALSRGKMVITTTASSLPEAGGEFALYVEPEDPQGLANAAAGLLLSDERRLAGERRIAREYAPRDWSAIAADICRRVDELTSLQPTNAVPVPRAPTGIQCWIGRSMAIDLHSGSGGGEMFRAGLGWHPPKAWGCRVKPTGGQLAFRVPDGSRLAAPRLLLRLIGSDRGRCDFTIRLGKTCLQGVLGKEERRSIMMPLAIGADGVCTVTIEGSTMIGQPEDLRHDLAGFTETVGIEGFAVVDGF